MADDLLYLEAQDEAVWARTMKAVGESVRSGEPKVRVWCDRCPGRDLALAGTTRMGPLFTSTWSSPPPPQAATMRKMVRRLGWSISGTTGTTGAIALLALPPDLPQEYPDLLVRCALHGDAIVPRMEVLSAIRGGRKHVMKVRMTLPRRQYHPVRKEDAH